jgi:hypothetical protein
MVGRSRRSIVVALAGVPLVVASLVAGMASRGSAAVDTSAPVLVSLTANPGSIDTSGGPVVVTFVAHITDDSGLSIGGRVPLSSISLVGPGGQQRANADVSQAQRISGNGTDGTYQTTATMRWHSEPGAWSATVTLVDIAGNSRTVSVPGINQTGDGDTTPPQLISVSVSPASVDTSLAAATLAMSARITDDMAGVSDGLGIAASQVVLRGPTGAHHARATLDASHRANGDALDSLFTVTVTLPRWSEQGTWSVESVELVDQVGNRASALAPGVTFNQVGIGDVTPPSYRSFAMSTSTADVRATNASVFMSTRVTDDRSGVTDGPASASQLVFGSPSGRQVASAVVGLAQRLTGTNLDGTYRATLVIPAHAEPGAWTLRSAWAIDRAGNTSQLMFDDWVGKGYPATINVTSDTPPDVGPTLPPDSSLPSTTLGTAPATTSTTSDSASTTFTTFGTVTTSTVGPTTSTTTDAASTTVATTDTTLETATTSPDSPTSTTTTTTTTVPDGAPTSSTTSPTTATTTTITTTTTVASPAATTTTTTTSPSGVHGEGGSPHPKPKPTVRRADGYWFAGAGGEVYGFGHAASTSVSSAGFEGLWQVVGIAATPTGRGYWLANAAGDVRTIGDAKYRGSMRGRALSKPVVGIASTRTGRGYWMVATDGGIFAFGDARFRGSTGGRALNQPIVGMTATPSGKGYWFVAADGGIFAFGDARFHGSMGGKPLNQPIVGMTATPSGRGYWLVARDGGIFAFGDARFYGSTGAKKLNQPIVGMTASPSGRGYWFVAADGGIFAFGDARFYGSTGGVRLAHPIVGMAVRTH